MQPPSLDPKLTKRCLRLNRAHSRILDALLARSALSFTDWVRAKIDEEADKLGGDRANASNQVAEQVAAATQQGDADAHK